jgi:polar amino acid transport system substrate-binding protein
MKKHILSFLFVYLLSIHCDAQDYRFVSINYLAEQEIGRIVLPQIYKNIGLEISITPLPGKRAQNEAAKGTNFHGEIMRIFTYGEENLETIRVPTPYYYLETMAFVKVDSTLDIREVQDLKNIRVAKVRGVKHTNNITAGLKNVYDSNTTEKILKQVATGFVDVALTNTIDGKLMLNEHGIKNVKPTNTPLATLALYHYIHKDNAHLVTKVDNEIKRLKENGQLAQMIKQAESIVLGNIDD